LKLWYLIFDKLLVYYLQAEARTELAGTPSAAPSLFCQWMSARMERKLDELFGILEGIRQLSSFPLHPLVVRAILEQ
jgi:hypothetical protein